MTLPQSWQHSNDLLRAKRAASTASLQPMTQVGQVLTGQPGRNLRRQPTTGPTEPYSRLKAMLVEQPDRYSLDPKRLRYRCPTCGEQEPQFLRGVYIRRDCPCVRTAREEARHRAEIAERHRQQAAQLRHVAYTWLEQFNLPASDRNRLGRPLPPSYLENCTFASWEKTRFDDAYTAAHILADHTALQMSWIQNLMLVGTPGTGKTHLAAAAIAHVTDHQISARFCTAKTFFDTLYGVPFADKEQLLHIVSTARLLAIDELDKVPIAERGGDFQRKTLQEVLNTRSVRHLPTIITANEQNDFSKWLEDSALSRIFERRPDSSQPTFVQMVGADYRLFRASDVSLWSNPGQ